MPTGVRACPLRLAGALLLGTALLGGCGRKTGALTAEEQRRIDAEGLVRNARREQRERGGRLRIESPASEFRIALPASSALLNYRRRLHLHVQVGGDSPVMRVDHEQVVARIEP
jgi:hypothetical protein